MSIIPELYLSIKANRTMDYEESGQWSKLRNREKTLNELAKGFEEVLKKSGLVGFEVVVKAVIK